MNWLAAALLGVLQGLTEFLPVSSTAHLLIGARLLRFDDHGGIFTVMIQLGSILAVVWVYREKLLRTVLDLPADPAARHFAATLVVGFMPAAVAGALLSGYIKRVLYTTPAVIAASFVAGGIVMLLVERFRPRPVVDRADGVSLARAFGIGCCQALALIPGVSRSGATIVGAMVFGIDRPAAAEFSFFLAIPTMSAAFAHELWEARHSLTTAGGEEIAIGFVMAFVASLLVIRPFLGVVRRAGFAPFAWYRIAAGLAIAGALAAHWL